MEARQLTSNKASWVATLVALYATAILPQVMAKTCPGFPGFCSESFAGQTCVVICSKGRPNVPLCQEDGTWTDLPRCIEHEPGQEEQIPGICPGVPGYCSESFLNQRCNFPCTTGPPIDSVCSQDGTWEPYPTCPGDIRETQDGCNPCPGPNGRFRNRTADSFQGAGQPRKNLGNLNQGRVVRPSFAGNLAFGKLPSSRNSFSTSFQGQRPSFATTPPPTRSPFTSFSSQRQQGFSSFGGQGSFTSSFSRPFLGAPRESSTLQSSQSMRPVQAQAQQEQFGTRGSFFHMNSVFRPPGNQFGSVQNQGGQPSPMGFNLKQRRIIESAVARLPSSVGGGASSFIQSGSFNGNIPANQPRRLNLNPSRARGSTSLQPARLNLIPEPTTEASRPIPQLPEPTPSTAPPAPSPVPTPGKKPQQKGFSLLDRVLAKQAAAAAERSGPHKRPEPTFVNFLEDDIADPTANPNGDFFGPFKVFEPDSQGGPVLTDLPVFPAIPPSGRPVPQEGQAAQPDEFGPFRVVPL